MDASGIEFLIELHRTGHLPKSNGSIAEIGAQELFLSDSPETLAKFMSEFAHDAGRDHLEELAELAKRGPARRLFELANWSYICVDTSGEFGAIPLDLNFDSIPEDHQGRYDLVTNFGCTEHIANQLNAFKAIHDLVKVGGLMIHAVPTQGFIDHGLVNYSAKFFWRLAEYNNYRLIDMRLTTHSEPKAIPDTFSLTFSYYDKNLKMQDTILWSAFKRTSATDFVVPFDGAIRSKHLACRYPADLVEKYNSIF